MSMNAVPCLAWVKRGIAKQKPDRIELTEVDLTRLVKSHEDKLEEIEGDNKDVHDGSASNDDEEDEMADDSDVSGSDSDSGNMDEVMKKYNLSDYEDDDETDKNNLGFAGLACFASNSKDPYISNEPDSDEEDLEILSDDNLVVACRVLNEMCNLEVYVYNENDSNLYVHHDTMLPLFPLALEWLDFDPGEESPGNLVAMGTMEPTIEIWDMDVMDSVEPAFQLAGIKKKKKKDKKTKMMGHRDAVLDLSWNRNRRNVLASGSADFTIGLWDLSEGSMVTSITNHTEKVQSLEWHPFEEQSLLSGGFDQTVKVFDCRYPETSHKSWHAPGEVEKVIWNHKNPYTFLAATDTGRVLCYDVRTTDSVFQFKAHKAEITGLALSSTVPGCLVTASTDGFIKVWDITGQCPALVTKKSMAMGEIHSMAASPDAPLIFAVGGEREVKVTNLMSNADVQKHFGVGGEDESMEGGAHEGEAAAAPPTGGDTIGREDDSEDEDELMLTGTTSNGQTARKKKKVPTATLR